MNVRRQSKAVGYAIAALVFGAFGLMLFWIPYIGMLVAILSLALAAIAFIINIQEFKKEIIVYVALAIAIVTTILSANVTYKTTKFVNNFLNSSTFQFTKNVIQNAEIYTDTSNDEVHITIHKKDSLNKEFDNLENIIEQLDSTNTDFH